MSEAETDVIVAGAGPTGLALALWLARFGMRVRLIDKAAEAGTTSRALVVHARTLEHYDELGIADDIVDRGRQMVVANFWVRGNKIGRAPLGVMGSGISPFPFALIYPQDEHERRLIEHLQRMGISVERCTELVAYDQSAAGVRATLRMADGAERWL